MLDDLKKIHQRDMHDALGFAEKQPQQYLHDYAFNWTPTTSILNGIVAGSGTTALATQTLQSMAGFAVPVELVEAETLPNYVSSNTLLVCVSYSGDETEVLSILNEAIKLQSRQPEKYPMIVVVSSGGRLLKLAQTHHLPYIVMPSVVQPRFSFGYQIRAIVEIFTQANLLVDSIALLEAVAQSLQTWSRDLRVTTQTKQNPAKALAYELLGRSIVISSGPKLAVMAHMWKRACNENAQNVAWWGSYPEAGNSELIGWFKQPEQKPYAVIELRSSFDGGHIQKQFELAERFGSGLRPAPNIVEAAGDSLLEQLLSTALLGDFVSIYLGLLNGVNPLSSQLSQSLLIKMEDENE